MMTAEIKIATTHFEQHHTSEKVLCYLAHLMIVIILLVHRDMHICYSQHTSMGVLGMIILNVLRPNMLPVCTFPLLFPHR